MRKLLTILLLLFTNNFLFSQDNLLIEVSGRVTDKEKQMPLPDVSVLVRGTITGTITNSTGNFVLRTKTKLPFTLVFSSVDFNNKSCR